MPSPPGPGPADRTDIRARFLVVVGQTPTDLQGAEQLCTACLATLPVQRVGISVISGDEGHEFLCASDDVAERMEWAQISLGEGPAVAAFTTGGPVSTPDAAMPDTRWPLLAREPEAADAGAVYALPLQLGAIRVGVLSLYLEPGARLSAQDFGDAIAVADLITSLLLASGTTDEADALDHWWVQPQSSREIHQATGMVVAQLGVSARDAYALLQGYAFARGRGLDEVAAEVVHHRLRIDVDPEDDQAPAS
ncbi:GAF and ANTAR domain-containing protein [Mycobacterium sp. ITM-2016-00316]|uniref:GAF and ANTAR domain-containing protein n=1 Tax=Mycobacterium sp. ITM-2016-00316 TaxID=2099695 RepID=UPI001304CF75|nr:GAF and ANTAR domain-containing protein [Mycobacterium sp. ITM-2016-00316]WNG81436.1 GAF and ANTAR domain-containing protein [Mycobacterium sp. ITM-2016-00316]